MKATHAMSSYALPRKQIRVRRPVGLLAWMHAGRLDRELAAGAAPWTSRRHVSRSLQLTSRRRRNVTARSLERLAEAAEQPRPLIGAAIIPCRAQVRMALPMILTIAQTLRCAEPVSSRGMASLVLVLTDGAGPAYVRSHPDALSDALTEAAAHLEAAGG
jgi:hypothetical protein